MIHTDKKQNGIKWSRRATHLIRMDKSGVVRAKEREFSLLFLIRVYPCSSVVHCFSLCSLCSVVDIRHFVGLPV